MKVATPVAREHALQVQTHGELLDQVLSQPVEAPLPVLTVPSGWTLLDAGPEKVLRVNQRFISGQSGYSVIIETADGMHYCTEVEIVDACSFVCTAFEQGHGCGSRAQNGSVRLRTTGRVLYRPY